MKMNISFLSGPRASWLPLRLGLGQASALVWASGDPCAHPC